jgi:ribosomal protein S27AE
VKRSEVSTWKIEQECPQCGGPVILEETDRLFLCSYCRVRLYLLTQDYFRYYLPPSGSFSKDVILAPYWRFKGIVFFCKASGIKHTINDVSSLASSHTFLPGSLGFRPQTLRLKFLSSNVEARIFQRQVPLKKVIEKIERRSDLLEDGQTPGPIFHEAFIGESISLIYSPLFIQGDMFHDAVLGKPVASIPNDFVDDLLPLDQGKDWQVTFVSTLCPQCGWDLLGERDSVVLFCKHCDSVWEASERGLKEVDFGMIPTKEAHAFHLPFWRMETAIQGLELQSYAELLRMANVPVVMKREWEESGFYFWAPAFKVPPVPFLRSTQALTLSEPKEEFERNLPGPPLYPANFPSNEAAESIKVTIANIAADKMTILPKLSEIDIQIRRYHLIFLPFILVGNEFVQSRTRFCIHKNVLNLGRNL